MSALVKVDRLAAALAPLYGEPSTVTVNPDGSVLHDDGRGNETTIPAPFTETDFCDLLEAEVAEVIAP